MTDRVMLDIETLGTEPGAAILSIGAVRFGPRELGATFHRSVALQSCEAAGLTIDAETLEWWLGQGADAREVLTGGVPLADALAALAEFYGDADEVWANSPAFDCAMLETAYEAVGQEAPWAYYEQRDVRTIEALPGAADVDHDGVAHDALDDAKHQARSVAATLGRLEDGDLE